MKQIQFQDCQIQCNSQGILIENSRILREYAFFDGELVTISLEDKEGGYRWCSNEEAHLCSKTTFLDLSRSRREFFLSVEDRDGLSSPFLQLRVEDTLGDRKLERFFSIWPKQPFLSGHTVYTKGGNWEENSDCGCGEELSEAENSRAAFLARTADKPPILPAQDDLIDALSLLPAHRRLETIRLFDKTDGHDNLLQSCKQLLYPPETYEETGNLFLLQDYLYDRALLLVKEAPTHLSALGPRGRDLRIQKGRHLELGGTGVFWGDGETGSQTAYGFSIGVGRQEELPALYRQFYLCQCQNSLRQQTFVMSNTWGDRSQDSAVCESFLQEELDVAIRLGVDILQIDDGWQKGITINSKLASGGVWEGYYAANSDFWDVHPQKFPHGFSPLVKRAEANGIALGLWFSPDSSGDFANWKRDASTLLHLWKTWGIQWFKLDGVKIRSKRGEQNFLSLLETVSRESRCQIHFNLDITAEDRLGYLGRKEFGTLFVENRYTDFGSYYPHRTLRNLWTLARFFPLSKFQFEVLNPRRNLPQYSQDPLAPSLYSMEYLFASVMLSNPLLWMEMSHLSLEDQQKLGEMIRLYREYRPLFAKGQISPIGEEPDGASFTGFQIDISETGEPGRQELLFLFFREFTRETIHTFSLPKILQTEGTLSLIRGSQGSNALSLQGGNQLTVQMEQPRSYLFLRYSSR